MARFDVDALGAYIREQRDAAEMSLRQLARAAEVSNPYLSQVERGLRRPSAEILTKIAVALRISAETLYVRAGILEERRGDASVTAAIAGDSTLAERQRRVLLEIYDAFQAENAARAGARPDGHQPADQQADQQAQAPDLPHDAQTGTATTGTGTAPAGPTDEGADATGDADASPRSPIREDAR